ncbi:FISUMP domain-containing protein [Sphingomonas trueperi]|uniref:FISUMP domain-containing protein n=1 Tax=Sphingomonas trueperi TaxID=53317 RepID=UPI000EB27493
MYLTDPAAASLAASATVQIAMTAVDAATGQPAVQTGVNTTVSVSLDNGGAALPLTPGASKLTIYLPDYIDAGQYQQMSIVLADWQFAAASGMLTLTYQGGDGGQWLGKLAFDIVGVFSSASPADGTFQVNIANIANAPRQITTPLPLIAQSQQGNPKLSDWLQISLDNQGAIYVSGAQDPLANTLYLNIKNVGPGPLYTGEAPPTTAQVSVSFVYGSTSGAIAPADAADRANPPIGSAWNILGGVYIDQTEGWRIVGATANDPQPIWRISPASGNTNLFGTGAEANVTFSLSQIVSMTAIGHTQMVLNFSGFRRSDGKAFDPWVVVLDIIKQAPPPTRGLLNFFGPGSPVVQVPGPNIPVPIALRWTMADVNSVQLFSSYPTATSDGKPLVAPNSRQYAVFPATPMPLDSDQATITIPTVTQSEQVLFTLQARNGQGAYLNAMQYSVYLQMMVFVDPRDNQTYPIVLLNNLLWMAKNLDYAEPGSRVYNDMDSNGAIYGRLYNPTSASVLSPPAGWRVPSRDDWQRLFDSFPSPDKAYDQLTDGPLGAQLGGKYEFGSYVSLAAVGYYHIAGNPASAEFIAKGTSGIADTNGLPIEADGALALRYVRDL